MYTFEYPNDRNVGRVCLEMSLKPFKSLEQDYMEQVCARLFDQWKELLQKATGCSILLWTADGSEILDYAGDSEDEIEWGRYLGGANPPKKPHSFDPMRKGLHSSPRYYMEHPPVITYGDLKRIVATIKRIGRDLTGFEITVGETFDPGPEFAVSDFKFNRHREILQGSVIGDTKNWVHCTSILHSDTRRYAAYPEGIPEGEPFAVFLGKQFRDFAKDIGFDYIWFSNGFGFSRDSWSWSGECFQGTEFLEGEGEKVAKQILKFWEDFSEACPGMRIETRGSNLSTGMDIAAHGSPLASIYRYLPFAPPNSPWAALDEQFGLELVGYMSHIAEVPEEGYLFRYYIHDPWWINSPWFDRYNRQPHDIYLPLSIARLDENLQVMRPCGINLLSADDSFGNLPRRCPVEVIPFLLDAYSHYPDGPGPVTWVYPFEQYHRMGYSGGRASEVLFGDWFIKSAIDTGMPLNSVISDYNFVRAVEKISGKSVLVMPVPEQASDVEAAVFSALSWNADVLLYGPVDHASEKMKELIGVAIGAPLEGEAVISSTLPQDEVIHGKPSAVLNHSGILSGGGVNTCSTGKTSVNVRVIFREGESRTYGTFNSNALSGRLAWIRGSFPGEGNPDYRLPIDYKASDYVNPGMLLRQALSQFYISARFTRYDVNDRSPLLLFSRNSNAYYITGYAPDTTCRMKLSLPDGAPIMMGSDCIVENNTAEYSLTRWLHNECRVFVKQEKQSKISCIIKPSVYAGIDRRIHITGLDHADVIFHKVPGTMINVVDLSCLDENADMDADKVLETNMEYQELEGDRILCPGLSGTLMLSWGTEVS